MEKPTELLKVGYALNRALSQTARRKVSVEEVYLAIDNGTLFTKACDWTGFDVFAALENSPDTKGRLLDFFKKLGETTHPPDYSLTYEADGLHLLLAFVLYGIQNGVFTSQFKIPTGPRKPAP